MSGSNASDLAGKVTDRRKLIAVMYADMVGYSRLIGLDDQGTLQRLRALRRELIDPTIGEHGGRIVQTGGDSLLIVFDSIDGAVRCAVKVQQQVPIHDGDQPAERAIRFRVGINIGDAIADGTDLHGDAVNIAARIQAECPPGGICVTRAVRDRVHGRLDLAFAELGPLNLKNIGRPVEAFVVRLGAEVPRVVPRTVAMPDLSLAKAPRSIRLDPLSPFNRTSYQRIGIGLLLLGREEPSIEWLQRALAAGGMAPPIWRAQCYLFIASAFALLGRTNAAHSALAEANRLWPFATVRSLPPAMTPRGLPHPAYLMQMRHVQEGLRLAGLRDHAEEDADFGVAPESMLHTDLVARTPTSVPGAMTIRTAELVSLLSRLKPIIIDVALDSWGSSIPDAVGLQGTGHGASFSEKVQNRFSRKMQTLA